MASPSLFAELPADIQLEILNCLDYRSLLQCKAVCNTLKKLVDDSAELQYLIQLGASALVATPCSLTYPERLQSLAAHRSKWGSLTYQNNVTVNVPGVCAAYELGAGFFIKLTSETDEEPWNRLVISQLPSLTFSGDTTTIENIGINNGAEDFAIDPSQDLITYLEASQHPFDAEAYEVRIHLRTLSTNVSHPHAKLPILKKRLPLYRPFTLGFVQIVDDIVAIYFRTTPPQLLVWNWLDGGLIIHTNPIVYRSTEAKFSFISSRAYVVVNPWQAGSLDIFTFTSDPALSSPKHRVTLLLPPLKSSFYIQDVQVQTAPFLAHPSHSLNGGHGEKDSRGYTTSPSPRARVYVISICYGSLEGEPFTSTCSLFFRAGVLLDYTMHDHDLSDVQTQASGGSVFREDHESTESGTKVLSVSWVDWGPRNTRFIPQPAAWYWLRYIHGYRVVLPKDGGGLRVLDFSPEVHRSLTTSKTHSRVVGDDSKTRDSWGQVVTELTILPDVIFQESVETDLPYWDAACDGRQYHELMIDEDRILGFHAQFLKRELDVLII